MKSINTFCCHGMLAIQKINTEKNGERGILPDCDAVRRCCCANAAATAPDFILKGGPPSDGGGGGKGEVVIELLGICIGERGDTKRA